MEKLNKANNLKRPNLLMNSDYESGIINQQGINKYTNTTTSSKLIIDGWLMNGQSKMFVVVNENNLIFDTTAATEEYHSIYQRVEGDFKENKDYIVRVYVDNKYYDYCFNFNKSDSFISETYDGKFRFNINWNSSYNSLAFRFSVVKGKKITLYRMKLEEGKIFTGMPVWNPILEELKCNKSLYVVDLQNSKVVSNMNATLLSAEIPIPSSMRKIPSIAGITFPLTFNLRKDGNDYSGLQATGINSVILKKNKVLVTFSLKTNTLITRSIYVFVDDIKFYLDSYDY